MNTMVRKDTRSSAQRHGRSIKRTKPVLKASSVAEYEDIRRIHPDMEVVLDLSDQQQMQLFDTRGLHDNG